MPLFICPTCEKKDKVTGCHNVMVTHRLECMDYKKKKCSAYEACEYRLKVWEYNHLYITHGIPCYECWEKEIKELGYDRNSKQLP